MKQSKGEVQVAFLALLKAGLWGKSINDEIFPLDEDTWKQIYLLARRQTVEGILFDGMMLLPRTCLPPMPLLMKWTAEIDRVESMNRQMNKVVGNLATLFADHKITAVLLKGQGIASCYDNPLHRICGDADWCFPEKGEWGKAYKLIADTGVTIKRQAGFSMTYKWKGCLIEHHKRVLDVHNPFLHTYLHSFFEENYCQELVLDGKVVNILSPLLTHLSVNTHILKHMLAFGIGIRQLCDTASVYRHYYGEVDGAELEKIYRKMGIYRWIQVLNALLVGYLGMPADFLPFPLSGDEDAEWMIEDVLQVGNFGFYDKRFGSKSMNTGTRRQNAIGSLFHHFKMNVCYAPAEACWFPLMQACSHVSNFLKFR